MPFFRNSWVLLAAFILYCPGTLFAVESIQIVSDLQNCEPKAALSEKMEQQKWRVIPYQTDQLSGHMLAAASFIQALFHNQHDRTWGYKRSISWNTADQSRSNGQMEYHYLSQLFTSRKGSRDCLGKSSKIFKDQK